MWRMEGKALTASEDRDVIRYGGYGLDVRLVLTPGKGYRDVNDKLP